MLLIMQEVDCSEELKPHKDKCGSCAGYWLSMGASITPYAGVQTSRALLLTWIKP